MPAAKTPGATALTDEKYLGQVLNDQDGYRFAPVAILPRLSRAISASMGFLTQRMIPPEAIEAALRGQTGRHQPRSEQQRSVIISMT